MLKPKRGRLQRRAAETGATPEPEPACVERGNFTHGFCAECGWEGPGRRARGMAIEDAQLHGLAGCGLAPIGDSEPGAPSTATNPPGTALSTR